MLHFGALLRLISTFFPPSSRRQFIPFEEVRFLLILLALGPFPACLKQKARCFCLAAEAHLPVIPIPNWKQKRRILRLPKSRIAPWRRVSSAPSHAEPSSESERLCQRRTNRKSFFSTRGKKKSLSALFFERQKGLIWKNKLKR